MSIPAVTLIVLALIFVLGTVRPVNVGALALVATFSVGVFAVGESTKELLAGFPADLFVTLVGVTYLFAVAKRNGTVDWVIRSASATGRGSRLIMPWVIFAVTAAATAVGGVAPAIVAMMMPVAMTAAAAYGLRPILMGLMVVLGSTAGSFSPLGIFGITVHGVLAANDLPTQPGMLFVVTATATVTVAAGVYVTTIRHREAPLPDVALNPGKSPSGAAGSAGLSMTADDRGRLNDGAARGTATSTAPDVVTARPEGGNGIQRWVTLAAFAGLPLGVLAGLDAGFIALAIAVLLTLLFPASARQAVNDVSWGVVLLVVGVITYVGLMQRNGTIDWVSSQVVGMPSFTLAALLVCFTGAVVSAFASTTGILGALIPLAVPIIDSGGVSGIGLIIALSLSSSLVDFSPFSGGGAMLIANTPSMLRERVYKQVLTFCGAMILGAPLITWLIFVLPW